jgi:LysM repeat protein
VSHQSQTPPSLVMRQGPQPNQAFPLHRAVLTLGRAADNDIVIDDAEVSRHHARLTLRGNDWILEDLGSRNGTFVNGQRITGPVILTPGSQVALGPDVLFSMEGGAPVAAMARRPAARGRGSRWLLLAGLAILVVAVLGGAAVLAYFYLNPPVIEARDVAELFSTGPDIAFQEPAPGTQVGLGASVLVFATARDEDKVTRVDLWVDDQLVVQQVSPDFDGVTPLSLIHKLVATTPGTHTLMVRAYDSLGAMGESPTLYVTVLEEPEPMPATVQYVVQPGDTPAAVALVMSTTVAAIQGENPGISQVITPGQTIVVPAPPPSQPKQAPAQPPAQPGAQPGAPAPGGQGPVAGGPGSDRKKPPPGLVPADIIRAPGLLAPGVAQIDPAQIQFPIGGVMLDPPKITVKAPTWKKVEAGDCTVTLSWQAGQQNERYKIAREPFPAGVGLWHWMDVPPGQTTYTDKVPSPGQYRYQVVATTEIKGRNFETKSSYETVTVSPSAKCIPSSQYKLVHFQPIEFKSKYKEGALFVTVGNVDARRIPPSDGKHYPVGDWSSKKVQEVWPAPVSVYLNPDESVRLEVSGEGSPGKPPADLGSFAQAHSQSEMGPGKKLTGGNADFQLTYYLWLEDVQWGKRQTTNSIKAPVLHLAEKTEDLKDKSIYRCRGCNPTTSRVLFWDWAGDKDAIEGYILYRGYSCPGQEGESRAPLVLRKEYQGINIPPQTEPVGCVARYQVSAFGRAGESDPSKELVLDTAPALSRVKVTFKDLKLSQQTTSRIDLQANQYRSNSENMAIRANEVLKLDQVPFYGKKPNNALTVSLDQGETLQVSLLAGFCKLEPSKPLDPTKPDTYQLHFQGQQGECWGTVEVGALEAVSAGQVARPQADIGILHPYLVGQDVYVRLDSLGPDSLAANQVEVKSYWLTPGTQDKPLSPVQTITRWWPALAETIEVKVGSVSDIKQEDPKKVPLYVKVTPLDFDDPYESNNVWQGEIPDLIPLKGEPSPPPKKRNLKNGYKCTTNDECESGYCADKQRCAPLAGQDGDYCHSQDHCEGFCLCDSGNDGKYCSGWESWPSGDSIWFKVGLMRGVEDYGVCRGRGENGAPCFANKDCVSNNCVETYEEGGIKRCTPQNGEGKAYEYCHHDDQCESRRCVECWKTDRCFDPGICNPQFENGSRCDRDENCKSGHCLDGKCAPEPGTGAGGEYCHHDNHCESGSCDCPGRDYRVMGSRQFCPGWQAFTSTNHGVCIPRDENGASCLENEQCQSDYCDGGKCAPKPGTGQAGEYCHRDEHCQSDFCIAGRCYQLADLGDVCRKNAECESGYCADTFLGGGWGRCARDGDGKSGEYCHHDNHCQSGRCDCEHGWFGFCANWEGWGRGSVTGTCK